jgi:glycosyltransferase involved in cell wall biosynthesis
MGKHIVFWLGRAHAPWDHQIALEQGIGGSELAALRLTSALAALGYRVTVYADIFNPDPEGFNPRWLPYQDDSFSEAMLACDLLVSSRCPSLGLGARGRQARGAPTWLWMHDLHAGADWGNVLGECFDKVITLTAFAKERFCQYYPKVNRRKVDIIPNGVYPELFEPKVGELFGDQHERLRLGREPLTIIWSSCPDRGLDRVLGMWHKITAFLPGAELHVYGDVHAWSRRAGLYGSSDQQLFARMLTHKFDELLADQSSGVKFFGQVGQAELAKAFRLAHVWFYPTSFEETSCITALEAQAAGTKIVCTAVGALPFTAPYAHFLPDWQPTTSWEIETIETIEGAIKTDVHVVKHLSSWKHVARHWAASTEEATCR